MADLALGGLERIIKAYLAIKRGVDTVRHNKEECADIERSVDDLTSILAWLNEVTMRMGAVMPPAFSRALDSLADSMEGASRLITDCQQKSALRHLLGAGDMAKQLRRVHDDIDRKQLRVMLATGTLNLHISISLTNNLHYGGAHPPLLLPQVAGEVNSYGSNMSAIEMRSGVNSNTTMEATGNAIPYASSSTGLTELNSSKWESTFHLSSEENIGEDGILLKQKIVIKLQMNCDRCRSKAMALAAAMAGVDSLTLDGECRDKLVVVGQGVDTIMLTCELRKKVGRADLLMVGTATVGPSRSNWELPARQRFSEPSSGSSSDSDESPLSSPRPSASKDKGKQQALQVARPHVPYGWMAHLGHFFCFAKQE